MAVDTRDKRASAIGAASPVPSVYPDPDGTVGDSDRQQIAFQYVGVAVTTVVTSTHVAGKLVVTLWSDLACLGGSIEAVVPIVDADIELRTDQVHKFDFTTPKDATWLEDMAVRKVIRTAMPDGTILEWRIADAVDTMNDEGDAVTKITCDPPSVDLIDAGLVRDVQSGGQTFFNLGVEDSSITPTEALSGILVASLHELGFTWITIGTVEPTAPLNGFAFDSWSHLKFMARLAEESDSEWQMRRDGDDGYLLDLVDEINGSVSQPLVSEGRNLVQLKRTRDRQELLTVAQPRGVVHAGGTERWGIAFAAWEATNVTYSIPADETTMILVDPRGGDDPVAFDDQLDGLYLRDTEGSLFEIVSSSTNGEIVADGAALVDVGDLVEIRADAQGTLLTELSSPVGVGAGGPGRVARAVERDVRGERNYVTNPFASAWDPEPTYSHALADGTQSSVTTVDVKDGPANQVYAVDDLLILYQAASVPTVRRVTAQATADGTGAASIQVNSAVSVNDERAVLGLHDQLRPDNWSRVKGETYAMHRDPADSTDLTGTFEAAPAGVAGEKIRVRLGDGSATVQPGDTLIVDNTGDERTVLIPAIAVAGTTDPDGSAEFDIVTFDAVGGTLPSIGDPVTIERPTIAARAADRIMTTFGQTDGAVFESAEVVVPSVPGLTTVWATCGITVKNVSDSSIDIQSGGGGDRLPAKITLRDADAGSDLASAEMEDVVLAAGDEVSEIIQAEHTLSSETNLTLRIKEVGAQNSTGAFIAEPFTFIRWVMLHIGPDADAPPVEGSYANELWQIANRELVERHQWPSEFEISVHELRERWNLDPAEPALKLGGKIPLRVPRMGIDGTQRIVGIRYAGPTAEDVRLTLSNRFERLTDTPKSGGVFIGNRHFVDISIATDANGKDRRTVLPSEEPPTRVGSRRLAKIDGTATLTTMTDDLLGSDS